MGSTWWFLLGLGCACRHLLHFVEQVGAFPPLFWLLVFLIPKPESSDLCTIGFFASCARARESLRRRYLAAWDRDGNGRIDLVEFSHLLRDLKVFSALDTDPRLPVLEVHGERMIKLYVGHPC